MAEVPGDEIEGCQQVEFDLIENYTINFDNRIATLRGQIFFTDGSELNPTEE